MSGVGLRWHLDSQSLRRADSEPAVGGGGALVRMVGVHDIHTKDKWKKNPQQHKNRLGSSLF